MNRETFETLLDTAARQLATEVSTSIAHHKPDAFEKRVFEVLKEVAKGASVEVTPSFHPHAFPDIIANGFGVEVKSTSKDSWQSVGNSVFEGMRDPSVQQIYVMFGKMGGMSAVRWGRYEDRIAHVRLSHAPRFVLDMDGDASLFQRMNIGYDEFAALSPIDKMGHVRTYARNRLKPGERLWWLEDKGEEKTLPLQVRLYMALEPEEKIRLRAEAALLCPQIVKPPRAKGKYTDAALYILTYHGVFCPQTRDLFSAGSVALAEDSTRGGNYIQRALRNIQGAMLEAAERLDDELFEEYWGSVVPRNERIKNWLFLADQYARDWRPSEILFLDQGTNQ